MAEPLAAVIYNSVLSSVPFPRYGGLSTIRIVSGQSRVHPDFFIPQPGHPNGKVRADAETTVQEDCRRCTNWLLSESYYSRAPNPSMSNLHTGNPRPFITRHILPLRSSLHNHKPITPIRRSLTQPKYHAAESIRPTRRRSSFSNIRHASNIGTSSSSKQLSKAPKIPNFDEDQRRALQRFRRSLVDEDFRLDRAFSAYDALLAMSGQDLLTCADLLDFASKAMAASERAYNNKDVGRNREQTCKEGERIQALLDKCEARFPDMDNSSLYYLRILKLRALALRGHTEAAIRLIGGTRAGVNFEEDVLHLCRTYEAIFMAHQYHFDSTTATDLIAAQWHAVSRYFDPRQRWTSKRVSDQVKVLCSSIATIVEGVPDPLKRFKASNTLARSIRTPLGLCLIEGLCYARISLDALSILEEMSNQRLDIPLALQLTVVKALSMEKLWDKANTLFEHVEDEYVDVDNASLWRGALSLYARQGMFTVSEEYFNKLESIGASAPSRQAILMQSLAVRGKAAETVELFHKFFPPGSTIRPNIQHYTVVIYAHCAAHDYDGMNHWLTETTKVGEYTPDLRLYNIILRSLAERRQLASINLLIEQMRSAGCPPNIASYTTMIKFFGNRNDPVNAEALFRQAVEVDGITPDARLVQSVLRAHQKARSWEGVVRVFDFISSRQNRRVQPSVAVYDLILQSYVAIDAPFAVISKVYNKMEELGMRPTNMTFISIAQAAVDSNLMNVALDVLAEVERLESVARPMHNVSVLLLTIIMAGWLNRGARRKAVGVYNRMIKLGMQPGAQAYKHIIRSYYQNTKRSLRTVETLQTAEDFLADIVAGEASWTKATRDRTKALATVYQPLLTEYGRLAKPAEVERHIQSLLDHGGEPNLAMLTTLLYAYSKAGDIAGVRMVWPQIFTLGLREYTEAESLLTSNGGQSPIDTAYKSILCVPLSIYIEAASLAGQHDQVADTWRQMKAAGFVFDGNNWNNLVIALVRAGEVERAFEVVEKIILRFRALTTDQFHTTRDRFPETPLLFPKVAADEKESKLVSTRTHQRGLVRTMLKAGKYGQWLSQEDDVAHPIHIMHQIHPTFSAWRPHNAVTDILRVILMGLQAGRHVQAILPVGQERPPLDLEKLEPPSDLYTRLMANNPLTKAYLDSLSKRRRIKESIT